MTRPSRGFRRLALATVAAPKEGRLRILGRDPGVADHLGEGTQAQRSDDRTGLGKLQRPALVHTGRIGRSRCEGERPPPKITLAGG